MVHIESEYSLLSPLSDAFVDIVYRFRKGGSYKRLGELTPIRCLISRSSWRASERSSVARMYVLLADDVRDEDVIYPGSLVDIS